MTQLLIVTSTANPLHSSLALVETALEMGYTTRFISPDSAEAAPLINATDKVIFRLSATNYVVYQRLLARLLPEKATLLERYLDAEDKTTSYSILKKAGIPQPSTEVVTLGSITSDVDFPFILKHPRGNRGVGVHLISSIDDLDPLTELYSDTAQLLRQEFVKESSGRDKRLFVVGKNVVASMMRTSSDGSFKANVSAGATATAYSPTGEERDLAIRACEAQSIPFAGVDIIDSREGPLVLEVNPSPGFKIRDITGVNVVERIIKYIMETDND